MRTAPLNAFRLSVIAFISLIYSFSSNAEPFAYITNISENTVSVIRTNDNTVTATVNAGNGPVGVSVSPDGTRVYVANNSDNTVSVIRSRDNTITATVGVGSGPIAFGNFIANLPSPEPPPQPVPTLSEWAQFIMMLMMIGTVGWYTRRMFR